MARTATLSGTVRVAETGATPLISTAVASETSTVTQQNEQEILGAAGTTTVTINFNGIVNATLVDLTFSDASTGASKEIDVKVNGIATAIPVNHLNIMSNNSAAGITSLTFTTPAGNDTICKAILAGV